MANLYEENMKLIEERNMKIYELKKMQLENHRDALVDSKIAEKFSISKQRVGQIYSAVKLKLLEEAHGSKGVQKATATQKK